MGRGSLFGVGGWLDQVGLRLNQHLIGLKLEMKHFYYCRILCSRGKFVGGEPREFPKTVSNLSKANTIKKHRPKHPGGQSFLTFGL